jgi:hypothetical protein
MYEQGNAMVTGATRERTYTHEFERFWALVHEQYPRDMKPLAWKIWTAGRESMYVAQLQLQKS